MTKLKLNKPPYRLVYLEWDDAVGNPRWFDEEEAEAWLNNTQYIISETGFLLAEDSKAIYIAGFWKPEDSMTVQQFGNLRRIPKNWIKKKIDLTKHL